MKPIKIRFYDNDIEKFIGIHMTFSGAGGGPEIETIAVDEKDPNPIIKAAIEADPAYNRDVVELLPHQKKIYSMYYLQSVTTIQFDLLSPLFYHSDYSDEIYRPNCGITNQQIYELMMWCVEFKKSQKIVFFDWDRTLSVVEGFMPIPRRTPGYDWATEELRVTYLTYILGGAGRFEKLCRLFKFLHDMQVGVFILTNNGQALPGDPRRSIFLDFIHYIDPLFPDDHLICSRDLQPTVQKSNKVLKLQGTRPIWQIYRDVDTKTLPKKKQTDRRIQYQKP